MLGELWSRSWTLILPQTAVLLGPSHSTGACCTEKAEITPREINAVHALTLSIKLKIMLLTTVLG